jgi:hypothetical protein
VSDTVTLELQGSVSLEQFAEAVSHFQGLIAALSAESNLAARWEIEDLHGASATVTSRALPENGFVPERVDEVVSGYLEVGRALEGHKTIPYPPRVRREAQGIAEVLRTGVEAVRFETAESDAIVREVAPAVAPVPPPVQSVGSYGAVTGRVQTLTSRSRLRFTLYDRLYDRAVSCYLTEGREPEMREMWDKLATVEGWVTRDPLSGRPLAVRRITNVTRLDEAAPQDYTRARGILPLAPNDPLPEEAIRRLRDGG